MTPIEIYAMLQRKINEGGYGSPLVASAAENMTDQNRVYVYTGSETGMETGHWYYYDGEDWADGGVYNSIAVQTDKNLTQENKAADGKATGDALALKVDKVTGKGLSTNDYTTAEKTKLSGIAEGATKVEIDSTLSTAGKAADAKKTGDELGSLKSELNVVFDGGYLPLPITYIEGGYIDQANGNVITFSNWHYTDFIDISQREENKIYFQTSGAKSVYNVLYDSNKQFLGSLNDDKGYVPDGYVPENAHYMRLSCKSAATQTLKIYKTEYVTEEKLSSLVKSNPVITVANYNVGLFNNGISGVSQADAPQQMIKFRKIIGKIDADIFNTQEFQQYFDTDSTYLARNNVMRFKYPYDTYDTRYYGSLGFSKYPISNVSKTNFASESGKYYISYDVKLFNKVLTIIDAHLATEQDPTVHRQSEIAELIAFMNTKDYVILTGDFNVASQSEYNAFKTAGYTLCNGGDFGWFDTWPIYDNMPSGWTTQWPCFNLDNIIVSSNIVPQYVEAFECDISDHAPFVAELRID